MFEKFYEWLDRHSGEGKLVLNCTADGELNGFIAQDGKRVFEFTSEYELIEFLTKEVEMPAPDSYDEEDLGRSNEDVE